MSDPISVSDLTAHIIRELSVAVPCDPRTLMKAFHGGSLQSTRLVAIRRVLAARGWEHLLSPVAQVVTRR